MDPIVSTESLVLMELALPARVRLPPGLGACVVATLLVLVFVPILMLPAAVVVGEPETEIWETVAYWFEVLTLWELADPDIDSLILVPSEFVPVILKVKLESFKIAVPPEVAEPLIFKFPAAW